MASTRFNQRTTAFNGQGSRYINDSSYSPVLGSSTLTPWVPTIPGAANSFSQYTNTHGRPEISESWEPAFPVVPGARVYGSGSGLGDDSRQGHPESGNVQGDSSNTDRITIAITHDKVNYIDVHITSQIEDAQAIRQEVASKLQITNNPHLKFDMYEIAPGESIINTPLNDDELLMICLGDGDSLGTLKFFVDLVSEEARSSPDASLREPSFSPPSSTMIPARLPMPEPLVQHAGGASAANGSNVSPHTDSVARHMADPDRSRYAYRDPIMNPDGNLAMPEPEYMSATTQQPDASRFSMPYHSEGPITGVTPRSTTSSIGSPSIPPAGWPNVVRNTLHSEPRPMTENDISKQRQEHSPESNARIGIEHRQNQTAREDRVSDGVRTMDEVLTELHLHGCKNITPYLNRSMSGVNPVAGGGFGDVYRGALRDGTEVGLKCVRLEAGFDHEGRKKVKDAARELYIWSKCKHPNVLELIGVTQHHDQIAMVSPWMENGDVNHFLQTHPEVDRYEMCAQIANGVTYLHQENVVHGDIKGANILVSEDHAPKITDFGTASRNECTLNFTETTRSQTMSIRWTAPEIITEETDKSNAETDVFSLGMTILEIITGAVPFAEINQAKVVLKLMKGAHPRRPEAHIPTGDDRADLLWSLLVDCWAFEPQNRPTAIDVRDRMRVIASI